MLERYKRCFEACGIELPKPHYWGNRQHMGIGAELYHQTDGPAWLARKETALCVCRCAAEDWLLVQGHVAAIGIGRGATNKVYAYANCNIRTAVDDCDEWTSNPADQPGDIHGAMIALCYDVKGIQKEPT